jgi:septum formation protein
VNLILASGSGARRRMLEAAGLTFAVELPRVDEEGEKAQLRARLVPPLEQACGLAEAKALSVSRHSEGFVIGADQMLAVGDEVLDKPRDTAEARAQLERLRGRTHELITAAVIGRGNEILWRRVETPRLTMRDFSDAFLDDYMARAGDATLRSVGAYQLEGLGAQLFERVEGDYFSVLGLPLLPLLSFLREEGIARA